MKTSKIAFFAFIVFFGFLTTNASADMYRWYFIPHLAFGAGYTSTLTIRDPHGEETRWIDVYFYDDQGNPLSVNVQGFGQVAQFSFQLPALAERSFALTGGSNLGQGQVQIASEGIGELSTSVRFAYGDSSGNLVDVVGILDTVPNFEWSLTVEKRKASEDTGLAISNAWTSPVSGFFELYQGSTRVPGTAAVPWSLNGLGHKAIFVSQIFPGVTLNGLATLRVYSTVDNFCAVALRADGSQYSSLPMDAGVQYWSVVYTDAGGQGNASWAWRFHDGYSFIGYEENSYNDSPVRIRGVMGSDVNHFIAEWEYYNSDGTKGIILYQGIPAREGNVDVINGTWVQIDKDGQVIKKYPFKASRVS